MQAGNVHLLWSPKIHLPGEHERPRLLLVCFSCLAPSPRVCCLSSDHTPPASAAGHLRTPWRPPPTASAREDRGRFFPTPHPKTQCYLVLEFPILKEPQVILTFQIVSINVAKVDLKTERGSTQTSGSCPTCNNLHVPSAAQRSPEPLPGTHPMAQSLGEARTHLARSFEELMCEVLRKEGKHEVAALGVRDELPPEQEATAQELGIWQLLLPWLGRWERAVAASCLDLPASGPSRLARPNWSTQEAQSGLRRTTSLPPDGPLHLLYQKALEVFMGEMA